MPRGFGGLLGYIIKGKLFGKEPSQNLAKVPRGYRTNERDKKMKAHRGPSRTGTAKPFPPLRGGGHGPLIGRAKGMNAKGTVASRLRYCPPPAPFPNFVFVRKEKQPLSDWV